MPNFRRQTTYYYLPTITEDVEDIKHYHSRTNELFAPRDLSYPGLAPPSLTPPSLTPSSLTPSPPPQTTYVSYMSASPPRTYIHQLALAHTAESDSLVPPGLGHRKDLPETRNVATSLRFGEAQEAWEELRAQEAVEAARAEKDDCRREVKLNLAREAAERGIGMDGRDAWVEDRFEQWEDAERMFGEIEAERKVWQGGYALRYEAELRKVRRHREENVQMLREAEWRRSNLLCGT